MNAGFTPRSLLLSTLMLTSALCLAPIGAVAKAKADKGAEEFTKVRADVKGFRSDAAKKKYRHHYQKLIRRMRAVAARHTKSARADDALYVAAQLLEELYEVSKVGRDLEDAVSAYEEMAQRYPSSNLADDALFAAATLRLERLADREGARVLLRRIVDMKGRADFKPRARELLQRLPPVTKNSAKVVKQKERPTPTMADILARVRADVDGKPMKEDVKDKSEETSTKTSHVKSSPAAQNEQASVEPQLEVLPEPPPAGALIRRVHSIRHIKTASESVVRVRVQKNVGVVRGEVPAQDGKPRRIFFDLTPAKLGRHHIKPIVVDDGVVKRVRAGQFSKDTVRLVVELEGTEEPLLFVKKKPFEVRLTVPLDDKSKVSRIASAAKDPLAPMILPAEKHDVKEVKKRLGNKGSPGGVSISQQMGLKIRRIVLDPGHGGRDTGAIGPTGIKEKDVTLAIAKRIRKRLKKDLPQIEVLLTRDGDDTLELSDRTNLANSSGADLFISIHANANPSRKVRGIETYYLNITHDRYSIRLAARENSEEGGASISDLDYILADLAMKSNVDDSVRLGRAVQRSVVGRLRKNFKNVKDLGLKHALFFVLLGSRMPAILVETSFLSNRVEEKRLNSKGYQEALADGVVRGVKRFLEDRQAFNAYAPGKKKRVQ
ncbi:MAG: AMIN domain-containing protein [Deltaproteobacteria bacterium]|nr:AMIN domain-containing protein [Deltaproteobacteria bacterium]